MTTEPAMNQQTTAEQLQADLADRQLEIKHLNAVNQELQDELAAHKAASVGLVKIAQAFGVGGDSATDIDADQLIEFFKSIQAAGRASSDSAGNLRIQLERSLIEIEQLKSEIIKLNPAHKFDQSSELYRHFDMSRFGDALLRIRHQNLNPDAWAVISKHVAKVITNMVPLETKEALCLFAATGETDKLLTALENSAKDLIHREEVLA